MPLEILPQFIIQAYKYYFDGFQFYTWLCNKIKMFFRFKANEYFEKKKQTIKFIR